MIQRDYFSIILVACHVLRENKYTLFTEKILDQKNYGLKNGLLWVYCLNYGTNSFIIALYFKHVVE